MNLKDICNLPEVIEYSNSPGDLIITGITDDSREVRPCFLFCARPSFEDGERDGWKFCKGAIEQGAQAIVIPTYVSDYDIGLDEYQLRKVIMIRVVEVSSFYAVLIRYFHPTKPKIFAAITGTNGKTSVANYVADIWNIHQFNTCSLGTLGLRGYRTDHSNLFTSGTTFDAKTVHLIVRELVKRHNITHLVTEASSHALEQNRLNGFEFDIVGFTNLTHEHLDYHGTIEAYFRAKQLLFTERMNDFGVAVINISDPYGSRLVKLLKDKNRRIITYSDNKISADLFLLERRQHSTGQYIRISLFNELYETEISLIGDFQVENILCAIGIAIASGISPSDVMQIIGEISPVSGRMELIGSLPNGASIYVDFAHTHKAIENVLRSFRNHMRDSSLSIVFGCGGDRDVRKRKKMAAIASKHADKIYITDDNPRSENPANIRRQIINGLPAEQLYYEIADRGRAIAKAMVDLGENDILVVAGKGHEDAQILSQISSAHKDKCIKKPYNDAKVITKLISQLSCNFASDGVKLKAADEISSIKKTRAINCKS